LFLTGLLPFDGSRSVLGHSSWEMIRVPLTPLLGRYHPRWNYSCFCVSTPRFELFGLERLSIWPSFSEHDPRFCPYMHFPFFVFPSPFRRICSCPSLTNVQEFPAVPNPCGHVCLLSSFADISYQSPEGYSDCRRGTSPPEDTIYRGQGVFLNFPPPSAARFAAPPPSSSLSVQLLRRRALVPSSLVFRKTLRFRFPFFPIFLCHPRPFSPLLSGQPVLFQC